LPAAGLRPALEFGPFGIDLQIADVAQALLPAATTLLSSRPAKPG